MGALRGGRVVSENLLYVLGTLANWVGWGLAVWVVVRLLSVALPDGPSDRGKALISVVLSGVLSALLLIISSKLDGVMKGAHGFRLPLVWLVMPLSAWIGFTALAMALIRGGQALSQITGPQQAARVKAALIWGVFAVFFIVLYKTGPEPIQVLKGGIDFSPANFIAFLLLLVAAAAAMRIAATRAGSRGWSKTILTHVLLVCGSIIFGLPFAFLLITSFKEDRDMASANGIVWVPKVQQQVAYRDPKNPLMQGQWEGATVDGSITSVDANGIAALEITDPAAMRGLTASIPKNQLREIPKMIDLVTAQLNGRPIQGKVVEEMLDGSKRVEVTVPQELAGKQQVYKSNETEPVRKVGLRWQNYTEALDYMPPETNKGLVYLKNTLIIVLLSVIGTVLSSSAVAYAFARMRFPGQNLLFALLLGTMMLPGAVTLLPKFLLFRSFGWIDTLYPLWVPAFFASAFNVFLLRQFFKNIPTELEDAARIDGCNPARTYWSVMLPLVKPALAVIAIWGFMGAWNSFMDPLIYISSPEHMPLSYALQLFQGDRQGEPGLMMAFATMSMIPVLLLFFFAQKYFVEGVALTGLGGR